MDSACDCFFQLCGKKNCCGQHRAYHCKLCDKTFATAWEANRHFAFRHEKRCLVADGKKYYPCSKSHSDNIEIQTQTR